MLKASDFGISGYETPTELDAHENVKKRLESIRQQVGQMMHLGDVENKTIPKMCLIAPPQYGGVLSTRTFIPHVCHEAIGVLGAVSVATACLLRGSVAESVAVLPKGDNQGFSIEHPSGQFTVNLAHRFEGGRLIIEKSGVIRTARLLSKGVVFIP